MYSVTLGQYQLLKVCNLIKSIYSMCFLYSVLEAVYNRSVRVVRCGGFEVQNMRMVHLELPSVCQPSFKLETVKFLRHISPDIQVRQFRFAYIL